MEDEYYEEESQDVDLDESPEELLEDGEISAEEEGFMKGYEEDAQNPDEDEDETEEEEF